MSRSVHVDSGHIVKVSNTKKQETSRHRIKKTGIINKRQLLLAELQAPIKRQMMLVTKATLSLNPVRLDDHWVCISGGIGHRLVLVPADVLRCLLAVSSRPICEGAIYKTAERFVGFL
jgi:hypothetical protein